mgnify:CR=1 FL=1
MKKIYKDIAVFVGGTLFGSAGIKLLSSKEERIYPCCRSSSSHEGYRYEHR